MKKIECTNGTPCFVSLGKHDNQPCLLLDFKITSYQVCNYGWKTVDFPDNIVINDKLYLDEETTNKVLEILDGFIESGCLTDPNTARNSRGFGYLDLKDLNNNVVSIQESSSAMEAKIWFGCKTKNLVNVDNNGKIEKFEFQSGDVLITDRLHLNQSKAKRLKMAIIEVWDVHLNKQEKAKAKKSSIR